MHARMRIIFPLPFMGIAAMGSGMETLLALAFGYLLGSIPFGLLLGFAAGKGDVRRSTESESVAVA